MLNHLTKEAVRMYYNELMLPDRLNKLVLPGKGQHTIIYENAYLTYYHNGKFIFTCGLINNYELFD